MAGRGEVRIESHLFGAEQALADGERARSDLLVAAPTILETILSRSKSSITSLQFSFVRSSKHNKHKRRRNRARSVTGCTSRLFVAARRKAGGQRSDETVGRTNQSAWLSLTCTGIDLSLSLTDQ